MEDEPPTADDDEEQDIVVKRREMRKWDNGRGVWNDLGTYFLTQSFYFGGGLVISQHNYDTCMSK